MTKITKNVFAAAALVAGLGFAAQASAAGVCSGFGPQTPRDISAKDGANAISFVTAPPASEMNLCNIHYHVNAEHKGPGFKVFAGATENGGYKCNGSEKLTTAELTNPFADAHGAAAGHGEAATGHGAPADAHGAPADAHGASTGHGAAAGGMAAACHGTKPGDTIEVHWVYSTCDVQPGESLGSCLSDSCANPQLRVESQVFLVVNDDHAANFMDFAYKGEKKNGLYQPASLPTGTGTPVDFMGSTTGTKYTQEKCSPYQVSWSVRPTCTKVSWSSLNEFCKDNVFNESHGHGVRQLVTEKSLLAPIQ